MASPRWFHAAINRMEPPLRLLIEDDQTGEAVNVIVGEIGQVVETANLTKVPIRLNVQILDDGKRPVSDDSYHIVPPGQKVKLGVEIHRRLRVEVPQPLMGGSLSMAKFGQVATKLGLRVD